MKQWLSDTSFKYGFLVLACVLFGNMDGISQEIDREKMKDQQTAQTLMSDAGVSLQKEEFPIAEADYRKAIALNPKSEKAKYNLGNAYYDRALNGEAGQRYLQAAAVAQSKDARHKAFHNLGNTFMNDKKYQEAVDAYKNALRNNPTDDETRYNLALAKKMLEQEQNEGGDGDDDDKEQDKEQEDDKNKQENKDKEGDNEDEGDDGEEEKEDDQGEEKEDDKQGDQKDDKGKPEEKKEGDQEQPQDQQPAPGQLSPQQVKNLLEAMNNEEKKVQEKMNAQKQKGAKVKSNKDW